MKEDRSMEDTKESELTLVAMNIIMHAGDARMHTQEALKCAKIFDFVTAQACMDEAKTCITHAHQAQTVIIQNEAKGMKQEGSLLLTHAQDTLMTIMSEISMSLEMIEILKIIERKIGA